MTEGIGCDSLAPVAMMPSSLVWVLVHVSADMRVESFRTDCFGGVPQWLPG